MVEYFSNWTNLFMKHRENCWTCSNLAFKSSNTLSVKKKTVKSDQFFSGDQYFSPTNKFIELKLTPTKSFNQLFFLQNKNQITENFKKVIKFIKP